MQTGVSEKEEILLSVIVPVYNTEKYLHECLDSLVSQTQTGIEYLLVNDGSSDGSAKILAEYAEKYPFFKVIEQENKGYSGARNSALEIARGKYIGFVDSDDKIKPNMYEKLLDKAFKEDADIVVCSYLHFYDKLNMVLPHNNFSQIKLLTKTNGKLKGAEELLLDDAQVWKGIYRNKMLKENGIKFDERMLFGEDVYFYWRSLCASQKMVAMDDRLYYYRMLREGSQTKSSDRRLFAYFVSCSQFGDFVKNHQLETLVPWYNHLVISFLCFGYSRLEPALKQEYFEKFKEFLLERGITKKSQIAVAQAPCGVLYKLRYCVLKHLHPLTLKAVLSQNRLLFDGIIAFREFLGKTPVIMAQMLSIITLKNKCEV